ncbi:hypothetical protein B0T25DRAFT_576883 [Lasiosphaeria hispida]|uniref:Uncharacterized protein n=1 Tax=Lasiosphaeria hispida TaxID=260671 RepID=A0AAJ0HXU1_9PEZI|nr:hypothetical protein B0T25DRAFT_576883 [Lasiosphaeria hispida]
MLDLPPVYRPFPRPVLRPTSPIRFPSPLATISTLSPRTATTTTPVREINIRLASKATAAPPALTNKPLPREPEKTLPPQFWDVDLEQQQEHEHCERVGEERGWLRRQERVGLRATLARVFDVTMVACCGMAVLAFVVLLVKYFDQRAKGQ